jgi:light-regulated signal transduction histidine kinase (bacteriophytochrome)
MVDGLLELSRIHTRGGTIEPTELRPVVEDVLNDLEARIQATGGQVIVGNLYSAEVDGAQIRRLFQNLIGNALKFYKPGVPPLIEVNGSITRFPQASTITITVKDNGIGFEEKYAERIFQPFQRLHGKDEYEGTGLGLSICQKIVERHHGKITAHSQPGEGSLFQICLPIHQPESER